MKAAGLKYPENSPAPFLVAKGKDEMAKRLCEIADKNGVSVVKNVAETEIISLMEIGQCIPEETYEILAKIFAFIQKDIK